MTDFTRPFIGVWELQDWKVTNLQTEAVTPYFDGRERGYIIYTADGWVSSSIVDTGRPMNSTDRDARLDLVSALETAGSASLTEEQHDLLTPYALSALGYLGYCGPYTADNTHVHHHVKSAGRPSHSGLTLTRSYQFDVDTLTLSGDAYGFRDTLLWRRITPHPDKDGAA
ncbi:MAG: lipocalin-like domain-containing protein [Pseudomonadota bacterium]